MRRFLETGEAQVLGRRIEICGVNRTGAEFPIELSISPIAEDNGPIFIGFLRDITARRNAEHTQEQHALKMEALYRTISYAAEDNSFEAALMVCLEAVHKLTGWPLGHVFVRSDTDPVRVLPSPVWFSVRPNDFAKFRAATEACSFALGEGLPGQVWQTRCPEWIGDVRCSTNFPRAHWPGGIEITAAIGFPIISSDQVIAVVEFFSETCTEPDPELLLTLRAIGQQVGRVFERRQSEQALRERAFALEAEIQERMRAEERQKLLLAELNHRVKNMLTVVTAIAAQTGRTSTSIESFNQGFLARLQALTSAHTLLTARNWEPTPLAELAAVILAPYRDSRLHFEGGAVVLPPKAVLSVSMILQELATNAAKYGALSVPSGKVTLEWRCYHRSEPSVRLYWEELGVGPVAPPSRLGFGSTMIEASVRHDLKGRVDVSYGNNGLRYEIEFPLD